MISVVRRRFFMANFASGGRAWVNRERCFLRVRDSDTSPLIFQPIFFERGACCERTTPRLRTCNPTRRLARRIQKPKSQNAPPGLLALSWLWHERSEVFASADRPARIRQYTEMKMDRSEIAASKVRNSETMERGNFLSHCVFACGRPRTRRGPAATLELRTWRLGPSAAPASQFSFSNYRCRSAGAAVSQPYPSPVPCHLSRRFGSGRLQTAPPRCAGHELCLSCSRCGASAGLAASPRRTWKSRLRYFTSRTRPSELAVILPERAAWP
jgi:hypothetical protein